MGHIVYVQGLAGVVTSPRVSTDEFFGETTSSSDPTFGLGFSFGLHAEISRVLGFNVEVFGVKGVGAEGLVAGLLVAPTFQFYRPKASSGSQPQTAPMPSAAPSPSPPPSKTGAPRCPRPAGFC